MSRIGCTSKFVACFWILFFCGALFSQEEGDALMSAQSLRFEEKVNAAVVELEELNAGIAKEKEPLIMDLNRLRTEVAKYRQSVDGLIISKAETQQVLDIARSDAKEREQHIDYARSLIGDYFGNFELRLNIAEDQRYRDMLTELRLSWEAGEDALSEESLERRFEGLDMAVSRLEGLLGGEKFKGQGVDRDGQLMEGDFLLYGPAGFFVSDDRSVYGSTESAPNMLTPLIIATVHHDPQEFGKVLDSGRGIVALDPTFGKAASIESARWSLKDHVEKGGYVGYAIIFFAGLALLVAIIKIVDFIVIRPRKERDFSGLLSQVRKGQRSQAIAEAETSSYPLNRILVSALSNSEEEDEVMEEVVIGEIQKAKLRLDRLLPFLAITAAATPLMGLLGTVVGMIKTFALITVFGSGEAKSLSSGISEALVTTEFGLLVAIPTLLLHGAFVRMSKERVGALEDFASDFVVALKKSRRKAPSE